MYSYIKIRSLKRKHNGAYTIIDTCQIYGKIFSQVVPLLYYFDQVHVREGYNLEIQQNSKIIHEYIGVKYFFSISFPTHCMHFAMLTCLWTHTRKSGAFSLNRRAPPILFYTLLICLSFTLKWTKLPT